MALAAGTRLGPYEVLGLIGAGGMGEVYKARDPRLGREVAIKVLPAEKLADPARRARFLQEARAASALSHPNIVTIHEIEREGDIDFLVMEYVAGRTLDTLIPRQGMRLGEVLRIAIPVADALATAHAAGIVHRDLKPANVMVAADGTAKVLDFGLAKLTQRDDQPGERSTTVEAHASPLSGVGTVAGTVGYMSPEQATGAVVDTRSDIFSFGALLYELVTGRRAFAGASSAETLAAILKEQPTPPRDVAPDVPPELERILLRCLRKDPARRFQSMGDVKVELQEIKEESDSQATAAAPAVARSARRRRWLGLASVAVLLLALATALTLWRLRPRPREGPVPRIVQLTAEPFVRTAGSFSPDGTQLAYAAPDSAGHRAIWIRIVGQPETRRLTTGATVDGYPAWSPDGKQIAFVRTAPPGDVGVYLVSPLGGAERRLADFPVSGQVSWSPDSRWLAVRKMPPKDPTGAAIHLIPTTGGEARQVTFPTPHTFHAAPGISPDGAALAYFSCEGPYGVRVCDVWVTSLDTEARSPGQPRRLTHHGIPNGGLTWTRDGQWIVYSSYTLSFSRLYRVSPDGSVPPEQVELAGLNASFPFTSRDTDRLGYLSEDDNCDMYRLDLGGGASPLVPSTFCERSPQYSPDGRRIAFTSNRTDERDEVWLVDADGSNVTRLTRGPGRHQGSPRWSPDGRTIAFDSQGADGGWDIWTIGVDGSGLRQVTRHPADENMPSWSRDGRFIYYGSNRTGRYEIWRVPPGGGTEEQVTLDGGAMPFESLDGRTLYFLREDPATTDADGGLVARPTAGGPERLIVECVDRVFGWGVGPRGVFHVDCRMPGVPDGALRVLRHWEAATGKDHEVARVDFGLPPNLGLSASPDGRHVVYTHVDSASNLMMIENFR